MRLSKANSALKLACCYIKYLQNKKISQLLTYFSQPKLSQGCLLFFRSRVWLLISSCLYKNCLLLFYIWKVKTGKNFLLYMESSGNCQKHLPVFTTLLYFLRIYDIVPELFFLIQPKLNYRCGELSGSCPVLIVISRHNYQELYVINMICGKWSAVNYIQLLVIMPANDSEYRARTR